MFGFLGISDDLLAVAESVFPGHGRELLDAFDAVADVSFVLGFVVGCVVFFVLLPVVIRFLEQRKVFR